MKGFVDNNVEADKSDSYINEHKISERPILFGFQSSVYYSEEEKAVLSKFENTTLYLGDLHSLGNPDDIKLIIKTLNILNINFKNRRICMLIIYIILSQFYPKFIL